MALEKQMELFEQGGLMQEGGQVDEESGNEVPVGSTKEEVRDDIPAQLSEGEFVMPADVVRYHGLDKMMALRQEAKMGLQKMEDMGMMGNSDEATLPDDIPFDINDLDIEDDGTQEFAVGGFVQQPYGVNLSGGTGIGGYQPSQFATYQPSYTPYTPPPVPGVTPPPTAPAPSPFPQQAGVPVTTPPTTLPTFQQLVSPTYVTYVNPQTGATIQIPVDSNGNPLIPVPAGFVKQSAQAQQPTTPTTPTTTPAPTTTTQQDGGRDKTPEEIAQEEAQRQMVKDRQAAAKELGYTKQQSIGEALLGLTPIGFMMGNPEVGTVLADGTIADGQGNSFDPITGKQVGYKGGILGNIAGAFGLQKTEAEKFGLPEGSQIPEASLAGLKSQMGEEGIQAAISGADAEAVSKSAQAGYSSEISNEMIDAAVKAGLGTREEILANIEATKPGTARVGTTLGQTAVAETVKAAQPTTVTEAATTTAQPSVAPETKSFDTLVEEKIAELTAARPNVAPDKIRQAAIEDVQFDLNVAAQAKAGTLKENIQKAFGAPIDEAALRQEAKAKVQRAVAGQPRTKADEVRDMVSAAAAASTRRDRESIQDKITQEMTGRTGYNKQYEADIRAGKYDDAFNARDSFNRDVTRAVQESERAEIAAAKSEGRSANLGSRPAGAGEVSDSRGNVVRDSQGNSVKSTGPTSSSKGLALAAEREQREADNSTDSRVICTELYRQGKLSKELYRMDVIYTSRHLSPTVIKGYHYWAIPTVRLMRKSNKLTKFMMYFTMKRAEEIAHIVNPKKYTKSTISGKIIKNVGEALCYGIGLFVNNSDYKVLYKGEKTC